LPHRPCPLSSLALARYLQLLHDVELLDAAGQAVGGLQQGIATCHGPADSSQTVLLDLAFKGDGVALLLVAVVPRSGHGDRMHFLLGQLSWSDEAVESHWTSTGFHPSSEAATRAAYLSAQLVTPPSGPGVFLAFADSNSLFATSIDGGEQEGRAPGFAVAVAREDDVPVVCPVGIGDGCLLLSTRHGGSVIRVLQTLPDGSSLAASAANTTLVCNLEVVMCDILPLLWFAVPFPSLLPTLR